MTEAKIRNDLAIAFDVRALEVVEQATTASDHLEQALSAVMVLGVRAEVTAQVFNVRCKDRDLNFRRARIAVVGFEARDDFSLAVLGEHE